MKLTVNEINQINETIASITRNYGSVERGLHKKGEVIYFHLRPAFSLHERADQMPVNYQDCKFNLSRIYINDDGLVELDINRN